MPLTFANVNVLAQKACGSTESPPDGPEAPIGLAVVATGQKDRNGRPLPEIRWILDPRIRIWEIMKRWALDVLKLKEKEMPKGGLADASAFANAGVLVMGMYGPLSVDDRLSTVAKLLPVKSGHRQLAVSWPLKSLPSGWGMLSKPKSGGGIGLCKECGGKISFRKVATDDYIKTLAVCTDCDAVRGCFVQKRNPEHM